MGLTAGVQDAPGQELYIRKIDQRAEWTPHQTFARIPLANWEIDGYRTLTWKQYADGINKIAHWLDATLGKSVDNDMVAYLGPNDIRYAFIMAALNKSNRSVGGTHQAELKSDLDLI